MRRTVLILTLFTLWLVACGAEADPDLNTGAPGNGAPALEPIEPDQELGGDELAPTPAATPIPEAYDVTIPPTPLPDSYPAESELPPYPATGTIWVIRPLGLQCSESSEYEYKTEQEAINGLVDAGVTVYTAERTLLATCQACDCPTSEHYRLRIDESNLAAAQALGWAREE